MAEKIVARAILEVLGAPKEHVETTLSEYIDKLKTEYKVLDVQIEPAEPVDKLFNAFAEVEMEFITLTHLVSFCFEAMPSSIDISDPIKFTLNNNEMSGFFNDLQGKLHEQDMKIKTLQAKGMMVDANSTVLFHNFIVYTLKQGPKTVEEISNVTGVSSEELKPFLEKLLETKRINVEGQIYKV